jgi:transcriptional regulator with XRE-family HTH domain
MNRQISAPDGAEQWLINLIDLKNRTEMSFKQIAEQENLSEKSVSNVFLGKSKNPGVDLIRRIIHALGGTWREIFAESDAVIATQDLVTLQAEVDRLNGEMSLTNAENAVLKEKVAVLTAETDILRLKLEHKEEIIALHNYYIKMRSND